MDMSKPTYQYETFEYVVGIRYDDVVGVVYFQPVLMRNKDVYFKKDDVPSWNARLDDEDQAHLAYGAALAYCDQSNEDLFAKGLNRVRTKVNE